MRLTRKLLIPTLVVLTLVFSGLVIVNYLRSINDLESNEADRLKTFYEVFKSQVNNREDLAIALAMQISGDPLVREAFARRDRETLVDETLGSFLSLKSLVDVSQMEFFMPQGTSFVGLHQLDKYDDEVTTFHPVVTKAYEVKRPVSGIEIGNNGLGVYGVVPVSYQAEYIGIVGFVIDIGHDFLKSLKDQYGGDWNLLIRRGSAQAAGFKESKNGPSGLMEDLVIQESTMPKPLFASAENYRRALAGELVVERLSTDEGDYSILSAPVYDYSNRIIGVVDIITDHSVVQKLLTERLVVTFGVLIVSLIVAGFLIGWLITRTLRPVGDLTATANAIAAGDFSQSAKVTSDDEIGSLATTFNRMTDQLRGMIGTLEQRVAERTKALETSTQVSRRLSTILDQNALVTAVVEEVQQSFDYYHAHIYLLDDEGVNLVMVGGTGEAGQQMLARGHKILKGRGLVGRAAESGEAVLVTDTTADPDWLPNALLPETRSEVAVPIMMGGRVLGVLDVQQNEVGGLTQTDVDLLQSIAGQVAVAVQNARLYTQMQRQATHETRINLIGQKIQQARTVEDTLQVALRELSQALDVSRASVQIGGLRSDGRQSLTETTGKN